MSIAGTGKIPLINLSIPTIYCPCHSLKFKINLLCYLSENELEQTFVLSKSWKTPVDDILQYYLPSFPYLFLCNYAKIAHITRLLKQAVTNQLIGTIIYRRWYCFIFTGFCFFVRLETPR